MFEEDEYDIKILMVKKLFYLNKVAEKNSIAKAIAYTLNTKTRARNLGKRTSYLVYRGEFKHY